MALNHYSHYRNSEAARHMYEVVSPALFEVILQFPRILSSDGSINSETLLEHVRSISGLDGLTPTVGNVVQKYKYAERHYAAAGPDKTSLELTITYTLNLNNSHENYIYNMLRKWYNLVYNPQNGHMLNKAMYAGGSTMTILEHDRSGEIWRKITCYDFFPSTPPTGLNEDNYDSVGEAKTVSITFIVDDWIEEAIGLEQYRNYNDRSTFNYATITKQNDNYALTPPDKTNLSETIYKK
jgi:hypothetical protein